MLDPNDFRVSDEVQEERFPLTEEPEEAPELGDAPEPGPEPETVEDEEGYWPVYHTLELAELRAIRELLTIQTQQFATVVQIVGELAGKADGLFSGEGPSIGGPMGAVLSALIPKRR